MSSMTDDKLESNYKGNALLHLLSYMKPYAGWVMLCLVLVLAWKMPGAGGGGYLALVVKDSLKFAENHC